MGADGNPSYLRDWFRCLRCGETAKKLYRKALTVCKAKPVEITPEQFIQTHTNCISDEEVIIRDIIL